MWIPALAATVANCVSFRENREPFSAKKLLAKGGFRKCKLRYVLLGCLLPLVYLLIPYMVYWQLYPENFAYHGVSLMLVLKDILPVMVIGIFISLMSALGEATHGNAKFQRLKLDVFQILVERYGVRAFALEGDFGGCEAVNRYIHGGAGTAADAAAAIGFAIYRTQEMEDLIAWMQSYNETAKPGEDLCFYGFDMQRYEYSYRYLLEAAYKTSCNLPCVVEIVNLRGDETTI